MQPEVAVEIVSLKNDLEDTKEELGADEASPRKNALSKLRFERV